MRTASQTFKQQLKVNPTILQQVTATIPGEGELALELVNPLQVSSSSGTGPRNSANNVSVTSSDVDLRDLWDLLQRPGATFDAAIGQRVAAVTTEYIDVFHGYASQGSTRITEAAVTLDLIDPWAWVEAVPFTTPFPITTTTRAALIAGIVEGVLPLVEVVTTATGGEITLAGLVVNETRTQTISKLAAEGNLDVHFDASPGSGGQGRLIIQTLPEIDPYSTPVETFTTGPMGTIVLGTGTRTKAFSRIYNAVAVIPDDARLTWTAQTVRLADGGDWAHEDNIGLRPFEFRARTITTADEAQTLAASILQKLRKGIETVSVGVVVNPLVEPGDPTTIASERTSTDPGFSKTYLLTNTTLDCGSGKSDLQGVDTVIHETEVA